MRFLLSILLLSSACASTIGGGPPTSSGRVNVASARHEINETIQQTTNDRSVTSMGKVTAVTAVVYTTTRTGTRQEEAWTKASGSWKLDKASAVGGASAADNAALR
jgi:hypothetical protein